MRFGVCLVLPVLLGVNGCERTPPSDRGAADTQASGGQAVSRPALRVVSTAPNLTEICFALGAGGQLVGRSDYCTYPPEAAAIPSVGALVDFNIESLLRLRPDVVLVAGHSRAIADRLGRAGLRYAAFPDVTLADVYGSIHDVGRLVERSAAADKLVARMQDELAELKREDAHVSPQRVLLTTQPMTDPPRRIWALGPGCFVDDVLKQLGHSNVTNALGRPFVELSLEFIRTADPDVIIELPPAALERGSGDADALRAWGRLGPLKAVATHRVYVLAGPEYTIPGPRLIRVMGDVAERVARVPDEPRP